MRKVRYALAGTGQISTVHAQAIKSSRTSELAVVVSRSVGRAEKLAARFSAEASADYGKVLGRDDIDAVDIVTCNHLHADMGIEAAEHGKHVLVEKPIDISSAKAAKLIDACRKNGVKLSVMSQKRYDGAFQKISAMIKDGSIGKPLLACASIRWRRTQEYYDGNDGWRKKASCVGGGLFINQAIHYVDVLLWLMGPAAAVTGRVATTAHRISVEDTGAAVISFSSGALGVVDGSMAVKCTMPDRFEVHGTGGSVAVERNRFVTWNFGSNPVLSLAGSKLRSLSMLKTGSIADQVSDFNNAIIKDSDPMIKGEDGKRALDLVLAIYESSKTGQSVSLRR